MANVGGGVLQGRRRVANRAGPVPPMDDVNIGVARRAGRDWEAGREGLPHNIGIQYQRARYFTNPAEQSKYYGVKRNIHFQRRFPLREWWYKPIERGSLESLHDMGSTYRLASARQRANRNTVLMSGRGLYRGKGAYTKGRGGFFGGLAGMLTGKGYKAGSDMGDKLWNSGGKTLASFIPGLNQAVAIGDQLNPIAAQVADIAGQGMYKRGRGQYKGRGEYVATNGLVQGASVVPQFGQDDMKTTTITNREYVADVFAPAANATFTPQEYPLNPGMSKLFAWLSQIAINYEEYAIKQLIVTYKSTVADFASASGQVGQVIMATQYNPTSDPFGSKEEMMLYEGGMSCKTTEHMQHGIECDPVKLPGNEYKFVRNGNLPISEDLKEYDLGRLCMAITGTPSTYAGQIIGELWVSYTIVLRKPKVASGHAYNIKRDYALVPNYGILTSNGSAPPQSLLVGTRNTGAVKFIVPPALTLTSSGFTTNDNLDRDDPTPYGTTSRALQLTLEFADDFEGCIEIKFKRFCNTQLTSQEVRDFSIISSDIIGQPSTIQRFKDMPLVRASSGGFNTKVWGHCYTTTDPWAFQGSSFEIQGLVEPYHSPDLILHLRVLPPVSGRKNQVHIAFSQTGNSVNYWSCEVNQFNSFLSATDNGRGPQHLLLSDVNGNPAIWA